MSTSLHTRFAPDWNLIKSQWDASQRFFLEAGVEADVAHSLTMTTQELLENAVKYGKFDPGDEVDLAIEADDGLITIEVRNPLTSDPALLRALDDTVQWIRSFQNPFEAFVARLKQVAASAYQPGVSGLGLVRIAYEAQCLLDFYVDDDEQLALSAVYRIDRRGLE